MHTVNMFEAKSTLSRLVETVELGREPEIIIARNGRPAARLVPIGEPQIVKRIGVAKGLFEVPDNIDQHNAEIALWAIADSARLSLQARVLIEAPSTSVWVSAASIWEIAIKSSLGLGDMPVSSRDALRYFLESGFQMLAIDAEHTVAVEALPAHHQDPFDRLLVAQALTEPMRLMTHDAVVASYSDTIILV